MAIPQWKIREDGRLRSMFSGMRRNSAGFARLDCDKCYDKLGIRDTRASLGWNEDAGVASCFRCGYKFVLNYEALANRCFIINVQQRDFRMPRGLSPILGSTHPAALKVTSYLHERGLTNQEIGLCRVQYATDGVCVGRAVFPHWDVKSGKYWGYSARAVPNMGAIGPKVAYPSGMTRDQLYNEAALEADTTSPLMVVEGVIDSARYLPDVVACLGKPSRVFFDLVLSTFRKNGRKLRPIVFCLDGDALILAKYMARRLMKRGILCGFVKIPAGLDPDTVNPEWLRREVLRIGDSLSVTQQQRNPSTYGYNVVFPSLQHLPGRIVWDDRRGLIFDVPEAAAQALMEMFKLTGVVTIPAETLPEIQPVKVTNLIGTEPNDTPAEVLPISSDLKPDQLYVPATAENPVIGVGDGVQPELPLQAEVDVSAPTVAKILPSMAIASLAWLPTRIKTGLTNAGLVTVMLAFSLTDEELLKIKGVGKGSLDKCASEILALRQGLGIVPVEAPVVEAGIETIITPESTETIVVTESTETLVYKTTPACDYSKVGANHEGFLIMKAVIFPDDTPGYLAHREDGMLIRFDGEHNEVHREKNVQQKEARGDTKVSGLLGATTPVVVAPVVAAAPTVLPENVAKAALEASNMPGTLGVLKTQGVSVEDCTKFIEANLAGFINWDQKNLPNLSSIPSMVTVIYSM